MTDQGASAFPKEEKDTERRKDAIDAILQLRADIPKLMADAMAPVCEALETIGREANRTNSFLTAHSLELDSLTPTAPLNGLAGKTVLVVDDEAPLLRSLKRNLTHRGALVLEASTVDLAIDFLRNARIDVALVDLHLPRSADGIDLARWICRSRRAAVVIMSGMLDAPGLDALPVARIPKPFGLVDLERVLCEAMGHGHSVPPTELPSTLPPPPPTGFEDVDPATPAPDTKDESPQAKQGAEPPCEP